MINKNDLNELEYAEPNFHKDMIKTDKLIIESSGDWDIYVYMISCHYFSDRKEFDNLIFKEERQKNFNSEKKSFENISIKEAFQKLGTKIKVNIDYFFRVENKNEYKKYVGDDYDFDYYQWIWNEMKTMKEKKNWKMLEASEQYLHFRTQMKIIKSILWRKLMIELFGKNDEAINDENIYMLKDFEILYQDGNFTCASSFNGKKYLGFIYGTS
uniref:Uncharacterized protein n=1 Tax=Panagrolaimus superbus TaxID=310955 RepID=A0A914YDA2_9BILA